MRTSWAYQSPFVPAKAGTQGHRSALEVPGLASLARDTKSWNPAGVHPRESGGGNERWKPSSFFRIRGAVLHIGPMRQRRDVLEALEVDAFVLARGTAGLEIGERVLDRARDAEDQRGRIRHHGEAQAVELARRQHRRAPAAFHHVRELRHALKRPPDLGELVD